MGRKQVFTLMQRSGDPELEDRLINNRYYASICVYLFILFGDEAYSNNLIYKYSSVVDGGLRVTANREKFKTSCLNAGYAHLYNSFSSEFNYV